MLRSEIRDPSQPGAGEVPVKAVCLLSLPEQSHRCTGLGSMERAPWTLVGLTLLQLLLISCLPRGTVRERVCSNESLPFSVARGVWSHALSWEAERSAGTATVERRGSALCTFFLSAWSVCMCVCRFTQE